MRDSTVELWLVRHAESLGNLDGSDADTTLSLAEPGYAATAAHASVTRVAVAVRDGRVAVRRLSGDGG